MNEFSSFSTGLTTENKGDQVETELQLHAEHPLYEGHFPKNPVTPGVVLLQLFKEQAERFMNCPLMLKQVKSVKFLVLIHPNEHQKLRLVSSIEELEQEIQLRGKAFSTDKVAVKVNLIYKKR